MKKQILLLMFIFSTLTLLFTGCNSKSTTKITVYNWGDYIAEETIAKFEEQTGIEVIYEQYDSNEAMYTKLKSGAVDYDVLFPSDYMVQKLIQENMLLSLDFEKLPNYSNIDSSFKNLGYDPTNAYSVPYMWGTLGILYNTTMVNETVDSWSILWNETYTNKIVMKDSPRDSFVPALRLLGYSINSTDPAHWSEALTLLQQQKPLVQAYVADEVRDKMIGEESALAVMYSGEALLAMEENPNLSYVIPKEGSNKWFDAMCIPATSTHTDAAQLFINFMCDVTIAYENAYYIGYSTPISEAKKLLPQELQDDSSAYPDTSILDTCEVFLDLGKEMGLIINEKWNELKAY